MKYEVSRNIVDSLFKGDELMLDDKSLPSVMVRVPKFKLSDVISGAPDTVHPAFIINGQEVSEICMGKFENIIAEERALSLPYEIPSDRIEYEAADALCLNKGNGWHVMTLAEWSAIALMCHKNGFCPNGNNSGDIAETGSGALDYSHDRTPSGIWDLNGNIAEWVRGFRTIKGELQFIVDNNAADPEHSQGPTSAQWKALDAGTGQFISPDGQGTTAGSVKVDFSDGKARFGTSISNRYAGYTKFSEITCDTSVTDAAKLVLKTYALIPADSEPYSDDEAYYDNVSDESVFTAGGTHTSGGKSGVFSINGACERGVSYDGVGIRAAYADFTPAI